MADTLPPGLQARIDADPQIQAAKQAYDAAMAPVLKAGLSGGRLNSDPRVQAAKMAYGQVVTGAKDRLGIPADYQVNYDGQIDHINKFTPNDLALLVGGGLATAGVLSSVGGAGGASTAAAAPGASTAVPAAATAAGTALPSTVIGSGFVPAITGGTGLASLAPAATGATAALSTGSKLASIVSGIGKIGQTLDPNNIGGPGSTSPRGSAYAAEAAQLAANRAAQARVDQGGPTADAQAFRNQMRAALVARMDPNAAAVNLNGHALPSLVTPEGVDAAAKLRDTLAARVAAGKTPTTFGIADPTQEELDAQAKAKDAAGVGTGLNSTLANVGDYLQTGSKLAGLATSGYDVYKKFAGLF